MIYCLFYALLAFGLAVAIHGAIDAIKNAK
jgi:hypothetical protein